MANGTTSTLNVFVVISVVERNDFISNSHWSTHFVLIADMGRSFLFGNLFVFFMFQGLDKIDQSTRTMVFIVLLVVGTIGLVLLFFLPAVSRSSISFSSSASLNFDEMLKKKLASCFFTIPTKYQLNQVDWNEIIRCEHTNRRATIAD